MLDIPWSGVKTCSGVNVTPGVGNSSSACCVGVFYSALIKIGLRYTILSLSKYKGFNKRLRRQQTEVSSALKGVREFHL